MAAEQGGEREMQHLGTHGHYMSHVTHDACLNVGVETGQGLQSAGHRDHGGGEAHDHFMARVMSALIWRISIEEFKSIYTCYLATLSSPQSCKGLRKTSSSPLVSTIHIVFVSSNFIEDSKLLSVCFDEGCLGDCETRR